MFQKKISLKKTQISDLIIVLLLIIALGFFLMPSFGEAAKNVAVNGYNRGKNYIHSYSDYTELERMGAVDFNTKMLTYITTSSWETFETVYSCKKDTQEADIYLSLYKKVYQEKRYGSITKIREEYFLEGDYVYQDGGSKTKQDCLNLIKSRSWKLFLGNSWPQSGKIEKIIITAEDAVLLKNAKNKSANTKIILEKYAPWLLKNITEAGYTIK